MLNWVIFLFFANSHTGDAGVDVSPSFEVINFVDYMDYHWDLSDANKTMKHLFVVLANPEAGQGGVAPSPFQVQNECHFFWEAIVDPFIKNDLSQFFSLS